MWKRGAETWIRHLQSGKVLTVTKIHETRWEWAVTDTEGSKQQGGIVSSKEEAIREAENHA